MDKASPPTQDSAYDSSLSLSTPGATEDAFLPSAYDSQEGGNEYYAEMDDGQDFNDNDSALGGSIFDTETIASYLTDFRYENGRRYHAYRDGEYWGPNDESEKEHQDVAHRMYLMTLEDRLHLAPLHNPQYILDLGTGSGVWAVGMADMYPSAQVVGTDLSPIQPSFVPPNCTFEIEDVNSEWTYPHNRFDFIHTRELFGSVTDWDNFLAQAFACTRPGGYVEIVEHSTCPVSDDGTVGEDSFFTTWGATVADLGVKTGKSFAIWKESKARMERAGFVDVVEKRFKLPVNGWPSAECRTLGNDGDMSWQLLQKLGKWNQLRLLCGVEGYLLRLLTTVNGWSFENSQEFIINMQAAVLDTKVHAYQDLSVVYGRKPETLPEPSDNPFV